MSEYFLGVDGGQSSTTALIGDDDGKIAGWATAGPCNHVGPAEAKEKFLRVLGGCIAQASRRAGPVTGFKAACLGMSGGPDDKAALLREIVRTEHLMVTHDAMIALAGATAGEPGVVVIAGTGSIAFGENERRETGRAGGWGYIFGDEGSAFDLVRQALRAVLREHEGWGGRTALTPALLEASGARDANELLHLFYTPEWPRARVASLAKSVDRVAQEGDPLAVGILHQAAHQLAMIAASVRSQLWKEGEVARVSWAGGVFGSAMLLERFRTLIAIGNGMIAEAPRHGPAVGALLLAYRTAGLQVTIEDRHAV